METYLVPILGTAAVLAVLFWFLESRQASLRQELARELSSNRLELQAGLQNLTHSVTGKLDQNLKEGFVHFERVQQSLRAAETQLQTLSHVGQSIHDLNNLLKLPHLRGNFGEATLERLLADWLPTDGYELQYRVVPTSAERVDAVVKYPKYVLPIDSKFPREQVLPLFETNDPVALESARRDLTEVMRSLARSIREKYIHPEHGTTDMALLFVPSETLYFEILRNPRLCEELAKHKVFAVSPNTLAVTLHAVSTSRAYYEMARGVEKTILDVKKAKSHFDNFEARFEEVGAALGKAQNAFNVASTHLTRYSGAVVRLTGPEGETELPLSPPLTTDI